MRQDFFANVSHELRTPIAVVRAYTESMVDGVVTDPEKVEQYNERILAECKSMERLVGDLLTLSKMQNPDFKIEKEPVNLVHIFDEIVRSALAISADKGIQLINMMLMTSGQPLHLYRHFQKARCPFWSCRVLSRAFL